MPATYRIEDELTILNPKRIRITKDDFNKMQLAIEGDHLYADVTAKMGFPLTDPDHLISFVSMKDGKKDGEIGVLEDAGELDRKSRKILREQLRREYFMPQITRINRMKEHHGIMQFDVETDKGHREFETQFKEDIRKLPGNAVVIRDADGNRYEIRDYHKLDDRSRNLIDTEI